MQEYVNKLVGTYLTIEEVVPEELLDDRTFLNFLADQIFRCEWCGWWKPIEELSERFCIDCEGDE